MAAPGRPVQLAPENLFPQPALDRTKQEFPMPQEGSGNYTFTLQLASAADTIVQWGRNVQVRDRQLRDFWPSEPYLAGGVVNIGYRHAALDWEIQGTPRVAQAVTDILQTALAGDSFGWVQFIEKLTQDLYTQDNGAFIELIRSEGEDANSKFKGPMAPVLGIGHLDAGKCQRTGNPEYPVLYTDRRNVLHKLKWYQVIPLADFPSAIETMNGVGYSAVSRVLKMAQIIKSILVYKDEKVSGRHFKQIHFVSGVSRADIKDEMKRGQEEANNTGLIRFILPSILASLDPEKPVSTATIDLASLPDGFDFDTEMKWYISCLALGFGVDYQEFAPLPGGNIGSSAQSVILHRKGTGKGPAVFMRTLVESFRNYGVLPRGVEMRFNDKDEQEELERQEVRTKAMEEMAIAINSHALTPEAAARSMVERGLWSEKDIAGIPPEFWSQFEKAPAPVGQPVGARGGNTILEDASRQDTGATDQKSGDRLRKMWQGLTKGLRKDAEVIRKENATQNGKPKVIFNMPQTPPPLVNLFTPKVANEMQRVERDPRGDISTTRKKAVYAGYVVSSSDSGDGPPPQEGSVEENADGTIVINAPSLPRQVINLKMPRVAEEETTVVRNGKGEIDYTTKRVRYEEE